MSVLMVLKIPAAPTDLERVAQEDSDRLMAIGEAAKEAGAIHHAFFEGDGEVIVVDEWPDPESFNAFFQSQSEQIGQLMGAAGATGEPAPPRFYRKLDTGDDF